MVATVLTGFTSPAVVRSDQLRDEIAERLDKFISDAGNQGTVGTVRGEITQADWDSIQAAFNEHAPNPTYGAPPVTHPDLDAHKAMGLAALADIPLPGLHPNKAAHVLMGLVDTADPRLSDPRTPTAHSVLSHTGFPGGTTNFLRADGTWAAPPSGGAQTWTTVGQTTDQSNNTVTLVNSGLTVALSANTHYRIRLMAFFLTNATQDLKYRLVFSGTTTRVRRKVQRTATTDVAITTELKAAFDTADVVLSTTGLNPWVEEDVALQVGANGGNLALQFAQVTAGAGPTQVLRGSYLDWSVG